VRVPRGGELDDAVLGAEYDRVCVVACSLLDGGERGGRAQGGIGCPGACGEVRLKQVCD
jgi:hypothetical protein